MTFKNDTIDNAVAVLGITALGWSQALETINILLATITLGGGLILLGFKIYLYHLQAKSVLRDLRERKDENDQ